MKKRRFAIGGFSDIDEGRDTPDQALARKASMSPMAASDKAAGLASTKGQDVGLKRLFMGNIDAPGSEASNSFSAGKGSSDRMAQAAANQDLPVHPVQRISAPAPLRPASEPVVSTPTGDLGKITDEAGAVSKFRRNTETGEAYDPGSATDKKPVAAKNRIVSKAELAKSGMTLRDFLNKERGLTRRPEKSQPGAYAAPGTGDAGQFLKKGGSIKAYAKGGSVSSRGDGIAQRGKTRGMMR